MRVAINKSTWTFFVLLLFAFLLRLYSSRFHSIMVPDYDGLAYIAMAKNAAAGLLFSGIGYHPFYPWLLAIFEIWVKDYQWAGMLVSIATGAISVGVVFLLSKVLFGYKTGLISALLSTLFPIHVLISTFLFTEATFSLLIYLGMYLGWQIYKKKTWLLGTLLGITMGASYLTRPEGALIFAGIILFLIISFIKERDKQIFAPLLAAIITYGFATMPYMIYLKKEMGHWAISGKEVTNLPQMKNEQISQRIGADLNKNPTLLKSIIKNPDVFLQRYKNNFFTTINSFKEELGWSILILALIGWISTFIWYDRSRICYSVSYLLIILLPIVFTPFLHPLEGRLILPYATVFLILASYGIVILQELFSGKLSAQYFKINNTIVKHWVIIGLMTLFEVLSFGNKLISYVNNHRELQAEVWLRYKGVANILNKVSAPGEIIMTREPLQAFYANRKSINLPYGNIKEVLGYAKANNVSYLVLTYGIVEGRRPLLKPLLAPIYSFLEKKTIYDILKKDSASAEEIDIIVNKLKVVYIEGTVGIIIYKI